ncbi:predicted protein [Naegleria gruberi]|uniref:Predicted protein n=1 Tax=Naegleria gruberi TaxID=5762 RepID=D2W4I7_NAEGR|nr:uncharacterized protein NAEGRDRAFT_76322 [Naegleria gruberi]EFC36018.1 predicted protein [Naegleria gruberi]|eukprot:XP_002668762.1 predicted protein [Naegleria gruberi strain NEG-M]
MPSGQNQKKGSKQFSIIDETVKTTDKIIKRKPKSKYPGLRKQLQNDEILKNYFVFDNRKDQLTTFRIDKEFKIGNSVVTQHVRLVGESNRIEERNQENRQDEMNTHAVDHQHFTVSNTNQQMDNSTYQQEMIFLLQLYSLLLQYQQEY